MLSRIYFESMDHPSICQLISVHDQIPDKKKMPHFLFFYSHPTCILIGW